MITIGSQDVTGSIYLSEGSLLGTASFAITASHALNGGTVILSENEPTSSEPGALWFNTTDTALYVRYITDTQDVWVGASSVGTTLDNSSPSGIIVSDTPPTGSNITTGSLWYNSEEMLTYIRYIDSSGSYWVGLSVNNS